MPLVSPGTLTPHPDRRCAVVYGARRSEEVEAYLPSNYHVEAAHERSDGRYGVTILGVDDCGWTLDGYILPRLASGCMFGSEVNPEEEGV